MNKILLVLLSLFLVGCLSATKTENSSTTGAINAAAPYKWPDGQFPKTLRLSTAFSAAEVTAIGLMSTAWSTALGNNVTFFNYGATTAEITPGIGNLSSLYDSVLGIYKTSTWPSSLPGSALAVTQIFGRRYNVGSSSEFVSIEHADILVNYHYYYFDTADTGTGFDLRTVMLHEMGHFLGLQHRSTSSNRDASVMYPSIDASEAKRQPKSIDVTDLASKYSISGPGFQLLSANRKVYAIKPGDAGEPVKIQIELHADGECVHKENGVPVERHSVDLKKKF